MIKTTDYCLPDIHLLDNKANEFLLWTPDKIYIVLGASNSLEESVNLENVSKENVTVLKRPSGGQTVVLTPNNLIISAVFFDDEKLKPKDVFLHINRLVISGLQKLGIEHLNMKGISDIAIGNQKISGSSIYRRKNALLYHAVLNLSEPASTFEKYLKHPSKEPDYRNGRSHAEFVTSLRDKGYSNSNSEFKEALSITLNTMYNIL
jgi:lipoate-protein ligase A